MRTALTKKYPLPVRCGPGEVGSVFPFRLSTPVWKRALGVGSVRGVSAGLGMEIGVAVRLAVGVGVGVAVGVGETVAVGKSSGFLKSDARSVRTATHSRTKCEVLVSYKARDRLTTVIRSLREYKDISRRNVRTAR